MTYPSKEFILSRESLSSAHKTVLKDIQTNRTPLKDRNQLKAYHKDQHSNHHHLIPQNTVDITNWQLDRCQDTFDRRLSLKCTGNYSQQLELQKSQRLSMAPLRR